MTLNLMIFFLGGGGGHFVLIVIADLKKIIGCVSEIIVDMFIKDSFLKPLCLLVITFCIYIFILINNLYYLRNASQNIKKKKIGVFQFQF